jgi:hypothetical protein
MDYDQEVYLNISNDNAMLNNLIDFHQFLNEEILIHYHKMILNQMIIMDKDVQEDNNDKPNKENFVHPFL